MTFPAAASDHTLTAALGVLSAMITPAVLILACGSLLITTSNRLARVMERVRHLSREIEDLPAGPDDTPLIEKRRALMFDLLGFAMKRGRLLQRAITSLYAAIGSFLLTSFTIGVLTLIGSTHAAVTILLSFVGSALMLTAAALMVMEARIGISALDLEIGFLRERGHHHTTRRDPLASVPRHSTE